MLCGLVNNYRVSISMYLISKTIYMCRNNHTGTSTLTQHKNAIKSGIIQSNATEIDEMLDRWKISTTTMLKIRSMFGEKKSEIGINKRSMLVLCRPSLVMYSSCTSTILRIPKMLKLMGGITGCFSIGIT